jgi:hypothetical protein
MQQARYEDQNGHAQAAGYEKTAGPAALSNTRYKQCLVSRHHGI